MQETVRGCGVIRNVSPFEGEVLGAGPSVLTKKCYKCDQLRPLSAFNKNKQKKGGLQSSCRDCSKLNSKNHYGRNKATYIARAAKNKLVTKQIVDDYLKDKSCTICGESDPVVLEFHHTDRRDKIAEIATLRCSGAKFKLLDEMEKCSILCANCHRRLTSKERGWTRVRFHAP